MNVYRPEERRLVLRLLAYCGLVQGLRPVPARIRERAGGAS